MKGSGEHRRGRSMGSAPPSPAIPSREKDDDLALFHEMKRREKHNFLHPSPDDLDATLSSKFGGMGAPAKKSGTDLLTSESDKNDYDWLLTPPGTPLFPSLDQEAAALAVLSPALSNNSYSSASSASKSIKSSTFSPAESVKTTRGNPSPRRQMSGGSTTPNGISRSRSSPSAAPTLVRPSTPTSAGGTRPSTPNSRSSTPSVRASTPNLKLTISHSAKSFSTANTPTGTRPSTPTPRSSTPPVRPSTPGGRSSTPTSKPSTPTMRRSLSGGRTGITSPSTRGGPSPKRNNSRGNSPSAKRNNLTSVITSIAGMSSEAPPNLRTTMPERSNSIGKGSNSKRPGSESGYHNSSYNNNVEDSGRSIRPRSPSVARSFSSSSSQDQRQTSSKGSGSVISSYDDGLEVNRPSTMGNNRNSAAGKWHATNHEELLNERVNAFATRMTKQQSLPSEKRSGYGVAHSKKSSTDQLRRPVDAYQNSSPTSAYRHLHSNNSAASSLYSTRTNSSLLRAGVGMNSSMTTSSNASSEHGTTVAPDTEGSERDEDELFSWDSYGRRQSMSPRGLQQADILVLDKDEEKAGSWHDSFFERAHSVGPSSSHSQGSHSTVDAEVSSFYETDGIASLEMLEQLGLMGENYSSKKSSSSKGRSSEKRTGSSDDYKASMRTNQYGRSRISPQTSEKRSSFTEDYKVSIHSNEYGRSRISPRSSEKRVSSSTGDYKVSNTLANEYGLSRISPKSAEKRVSSTGDYKVSNTLANERGLSRISPQPAEKRASSTEDYKVSNVLHEYGISRISPQSAAGKRTSSTEDSSKVSNILNNEYGRSRTSPHKSPARHPAVVEKQETSEAPRRSRDFDSKIPSYLVFQESQGTPAGKSANLENQEFPERPMKSSPNRIYRESQGSPARIPALEKQESLERPRKSRDFESRISPSRNSPSRISPRRMSPARNFGQLEKQEVSELPRRSQDFENFEKELLKRNGEKSQLGMPEPQLNNSEIRAACLFVRDFKVGLSAPQNQTASPQTQQSPGLIKRHGIDEAEMKLRNELSYDWDNSLEAMEEPMLLDSNGDLERKLRLSPTPLLEPTKKNNVSSGPESSARLSLELFSFTPDPPLYHRHVNDSVVTPEVSNHGSPTQQTRKPAVSLVDEVNAEVNRAMSMNGSPKSALTENEYEVMDESESEFSVPREADLYSSVPAKSSRPRAMLGAMLSDHESESEFSVARESDLGSPVPAKSSRPRATLGAMPSDLESETEFSVAVPAKSSGPRATLGAMLSDRSEDGTYAMEEELPAPEEDARAYESEEESEVLECPEGGYGDVMEKHDYASMDLDAIDIPVPENPEEGEVTVDDVDDKFSQAETHQEVPPQEETLETPRPSGDNAATGWYSGAAKKNAQAVVEEEQWQLDSQREVLDNSLETVQFSVEEKELVYEVEADETHGSVVQTVRGVDTNGNHPDPTSEYVEKDSTGSHDQESVLAEETGDHCSHELPDQAHKFSTSNVKETAPWEQELPEQAYKLSALDDKETAPWEQELPEQAYKLSPLNAKDTAPWEHELPDQAYKLSALNVKETSPWDLNALSDEKCEGNQELAFYDNLKSPLVYQDQEDVLISGPKLDGAQDGVTDLEEDMQLVKGATVFFSNHHLQKESPRLECFDTECVTAADAAGNEVSSPLSIDPYPEVLQSPSSSTSESPKELHCLPDVSEGVGFKQYDPSSMECSLESPREQKDHFQSKGSVGFEQYNPPSIECSLEDPKEEKDHFQSKVTEVDAGDVKTQELPYGISDGCKIEDNCKLKSVEFVDKHTEVPELLLSLKLEKEGKPQKTEFRSASTLCAALEEQIAGLIQKIDSAIEESSRPFNTSPQESLLVKDKRSILEAEEDSCTVSKRSSQEEDILDMLWADGNDTSGSSDQEVKNSKEFSQREKNGVRSCRLNSRGEPISLVTQKSFDAGLRSSRSDLGVEKRMLEETSRRSSISTVDRHEDILQKSPVKSPRSWSKELTTRDIAVGCISPVDRQDDFVQKSPVKSPRSWSKELFRPNSGLQTTEDVPLEESDHPKSFHFQPEAASKIDVSKELFPQTSVLRESSPDDFHFHVEAKPDMGTTDGDHLNPSENLQSLSFGHLNPTEDLQSLAFGQEEDHSDDSQTESSSCADSEDMKAEADLLSLCTGDDEPVDAAGTQTPSEPEAQGVQQEALPPKETSEGDAATRSEESSHEAGESLEAAERALPYEDVPQGTISPPPEVDISNVVSNGNGNGVTLDTRDQSIQELAHNRDRDESPALPTLARSEGGLKAVNEVSNDEWLHHKDTSVGQVESAKELDNEPQRYGVWEAQQDMSETVSTSSLEAEAVDAEPEKEEETEGKGSVHLDDHPVSDADTESVEECGGVANLHELRVSPQHEVSSGPTSSDAGAAEEIESTSGREFEDGSKVMIDGTSSDHSIESTQIPESHSSLHSIQQLTIDSDAEVREEEGEELQEANPRGRQISPTESQRSLRSGPLNSCSYDQLPFDGAESVEEVSTSERRPEISRDTSMDDPQEEFSFSNGSQAFWRGHRISSIFDSKISRAERGPFRVEDKNSGAELRRQHSSLSAGHVEEKDSGVELRRQHSSLSAGHVEERDSGVELRRQHSSPLSAGHVDSTNVRENGGTDAHASDEAELQERKTHFKAGRFAGSPVSIGQQDVTRISLWSELPISPRKPAFKEDTKANGGDLAAVNTNGYGDLRTREDKDSRVGTGSVERLPLDKPKSVRTISLSRSFSPKSLTVSPKSLTVSPKAQTEWPVEEPSSPEQVSTPQKSNALTNVMVTSPKSVQVDDDDAATKPRSSLSRSITLAESVDTILFCSSLMHSMAYNAVAYAEETASLASTQISNGEAPQKPEVLNREETDSEVSESRISKPQGVSNGSVSAPRTLKDMVDETMPPADTSLQIPVKQDMENVKSVLATSQTAPVKPKDEVVRGKVAKGGRCGCSIM